MGERRARSGGGLSHGCAGGGNVGLTAGNMLDNDSKYLYIKIT